MYGFDDKLVVRHVPSGIKASVPLRTRRSMHQVKQIAISLLFSRLWAANQLEVSPKDITEEVYHADNQNS